ncbi:hypothetical protein Taro_033538 [Colocasia esculenta]|uniref:Protein FAR1-RELATED SEQUENCE n=1 Tax=Colocasia esculenta TaxID=4460 RepID=A0A843W504_COLES|nr:hypothetical protein [Colocasia esculenta]
MIEYFLLMQLRNPMFFYALDLNDDDQLRNIFWIDGRSRMACTYFSDVITFDTTYLTNTYQMPFAPFAGVNHRGQSILLGCALLSNEKIKSFVWVFKAWLESNGNKASKAIITDQDKAMEVAIAEIFPNARHRWCLWHIMKKIPEKIGHICSKYLDFIDDFHGCIYDSITTHEFEERWDQILKNYEECNDNEWMKSLYDSRLKWAPIFLKDTFFAGMSSSQRSESIHHFFDGFVQSKTTLGEFIDKYIVALGSRYDAENEADVKTMETAPFLRTSSPFEKQASSIYTRGIFKKFQEELMEIASCVPTIIHDDDKKLTMRIKSFENIKVKHVDKIIAKEFTVSVDRTEDLVACTYKSFEFRAYLCRHTLVVLQFAGIVRIPERYILK